MNARVQHVCPDRSSACSVSLCGYRGEKRITLLRVIPAMTLIRFVTGKSSGMYFDILSGIPSGILSGISLGIVSGISSRILCSILSGISSGILSDFLFFVLFGISSGIVSGCRGPAVRTELGRSQVEVQRISLMSQGPRLRSSGAGLDRKVPG